MSVLSWLAQANPGLSRLLDNTLGHRWRLDLDQLQRLNDYRADAAFQAQFMAVKRINKVRLAQYIQKTTGVIVSPDSLFDVQVKRIHEYKRQLLNVLHVVTRYQAILANPDADWVPRTVIFAGKAASSYHTAKAIIHLIHDVGRVINNDPRLGDLRLECRAGMDSGLISNDPAIISWLSSMLYSTDKVCSEPDGNYLFFTDRPLLGVTLVHGERRLALPFKMLYAGGEQTPASLPYCDCQVLLDRTYYAPLWDKNWPDDTLLEFDYMDEVAP